MIGWRGKIGLVSPGIDFPHASELLPLLPEGVSFTVSTLGIERLVPEQIKSVFAMFPERLRILARQDCDCLIAGGTPLFTFMGFDRTQEMVQEIQKEVGLPVFTDLGSHFDALRFLNAKKIVIATPYEEARNQERKKLCEAEGFKVLAIKGLGLQRRSDFSRQPPYASYRLAKQAFLEAPEADAIYISCPEWATVHNIQRLEDDLGKPVVAHLNGMVWAALRAMNVHQPVRGFGRLLESI